VGAVQTSTHTTPKLIDVLSTRPIVILATSTARRLINHVSHVK
jgi:hypothetical protein